MIKSKWEIVSSPAICKYCEKKIETEESFYSILTGEEDALTRHDICIDCWNTKAGYPGAFAFWLTTRLKKDIPKRKYAKIDIEIVWNIFSSMAETTNEKQEEELRYILSLMLLRRRKLKLIESQPGIMKFEDKDQHCHKVVDSDLSEKRITELTDRLGELLWEREFAAIAGT